MKSVLIFKIPELNVQEKFVRKKEVHFYTIFFFNYYLSMISFIYIISTPKPNHRSTLTALCVHLGSESDLAPPAPARLEPK
jgi:hypothetical protein